MMSEKSTEKIEPLGIGALNDKFDRLHNYLRISLIERCNLRCSYCMPEEGIPHREKTEFMTHEEVIFISKIFVGLGVDKIRLTGGEPLIKKGFDIILNELSKLPVSLALTTNGILLEHYWKNFQMANLTSLNISLDSLQRKKFKEITRRDNFERVFKNIQTATKLGFNVKLNVVLMRGINDDEILDFVRFTMDKKVDVRFIEFMPFDNNNWDWSKKVSFEEILNQVRMEFGHETIIPVALEPNSTSRNFRISGSVGTFGIISSITNPFCDTCNRIRLTADGKIKNCLFSNDETDLLTALRSGQDVEMLIRKNILRKHKERGGSAPFSSEDFKIDNRVMTAIGG